MFNDSSGNFVQNMKNPKRKLLVENESLHKSTIDSNREIKASSKYHFHQ